MRVKSCFLEESERYIKQQYMTDLAGTLYERELLRALQQSKENCSGSVRKGIEAIELKMQGYSGRDIAERYHVKPNYITACISRAQKHLRQDVVFVRKVA